MGATQSKSTPSRSHTRRIDIHHHFFPANLAKEQKNRTIGWRTPSENLPWSPELSLKAMDASGVDFAILSLPAVSDGSVGAENRTLTRVRNLYAHNICKTYPERFGFFASLPFLDDVEGALAEVAYVLDELGADGIALTSSYGEAGNATYLGDDRYDPIWAELDKRRAIVFLHGAQTPSSTPFPHPFLGLPVTEVPNETFKAAAHLVVTGKKRRYLNVRIILAHLGGSTPFLAARVAVLSRHMGSTLTPEEMLEDFRSFYYETALSAYEANLAAMDTFVPPDRVLFGTDFPAVSLEMSGWFTKNLEEYYSSDPDQLIGIMHRNALKLFPRLN